MYRWMHVLGGLLFCLFIVVPTATAQEQDAEQWTGKLKDGTVINKADLQRILAKHKKWLESKGKEGRRAELSSANLNNVDLCNAILFGANLADADLASAKLTNSMLTGANLTKAVLRKADLTDAYLIDAMLIDANLTRADLTNAYLIGADLTGAILGSANLTKAKLFNATLSGAMLSNANLTDAHLNDANLSNANLHQAYLVNARLVGANLTKAKLAGADLTKARLWKADLTQANLIDACLIDTDLTDVNLTGADLTDANLTGADLREADLSGANLAGADMTDVNLTDADLNKAYLVGADMTNAKLLRTDLSNAEMHTANLSSVLFEPKPGCLPNIAQIAQSENLYALTFAGSRHGLVELRKAFKDKGLRKQEQEMTRILMQKKEDKAAGIEKIFYLFLEETCDYGRSPSRPLVILVIYLIPAFSGIYIIALKMCPIVHFMTMRRLPSKIGWWALERVGGIWMVWPDDRVLKDKGSRGPELVNTRKLWFIWYAFLFSILSAFHIGWRYLDVGNWLARILPHEYNLRGTGWVKMLSGIQSLISIILLVLFILTYFGSPFNNL